MTESVIKALGLRKRFGQVSALDGLDLEVARGEVHGFLGPNGAGKTTTIRILLGLIRADGGSALLFGGDPWSDATELHRRLAYVPGDVTLWPNLTGGEVIDLLGRLRGGLDIAKKEQLLNRFDLDPSKKSRTYSKGNRQKVALVAALAASVELFILDEPTAGLDPLMEAEFRSCIEEDRRNGRTVLLASHILAEVEALCDQISIVRAGRIVESGSLAELRHLTRTTISAEIDKNPSVLAGLPGVHNLVVRHNNSTRPNSTPPNSILENSNWYKVDLEVDSDYLGEVLSNVARLGVRSLISQPPTLEQLFLRHYRDEVVM